mmetsp:Transcript_29591/g.81353  ORF Transcript_29591/g.81353 Transcript_29591/m.81353 type:complete len:235 (+) Transcript_29591:137-841(+)
MRLMWKQRGVQQGHPQGRKRQGGQDGRTPCWHVQEARGVANVTTAGTADADGRRGGDVSGEGAERLPGEHGAHLAHHLHPTVGHAHHAIPGGDLCAVEASQRAHSVHARQAHNLQCACQGKWQGYGSTTPGHCRAVAAPCQAAQPHARQPCGDQAGQRMAAAQARGEEPGEEGTARPTDLCPEQQRCRLQIRGGQARAPQVDSAPLLDTLGGAEAQHVARHENQQHRAAPNCRR